MSHFALFKQLLPNKYWWLDQFHAMKFNLKECGSICASLSISWMKMDDNNNNGFYNYSYQFQITSLCISQKYERFMGFFLRFFSFLCILLYTIFWFNNIKYKVQYILNRNSREGQIAVKMLLEFRSFWKKHENTYFYSCSSTFPTFIKTLSGARTFKQHFTLQNESEKLSCSTMLMYQHKFTGRSSKTNVRP